MHFIHDEDANTDSLSAKTLYTSFRGRITSAQKSAIERYGNQYLITDLANHVDLARTTSRQKLKIEILVQQLMKMRKKQFKPLFLGRLYREVKIYHLLKNSNIKKRRISFY